MYLYLLHYSTIASSMVTQVCSHCMLYNNSRLPFTCVFISSPSTHSCVHPHVNSSLPVVQFDCHLLCGSLSCSRLGSQHQKQKKQMNMKRNIQICRSRVYKCASYIYFFHEYSVFQLMCHAASRHQTIFLLFICVIHFVWIIS